MSINKSRIIKYINNGNYDSALNLLNKDSSKELEHYLLKSRIYRLQGELDIAMELLSYHSPEVDETIMSTQFQMETAYVLWLQGKNVKAYEILMEIRPRIKFFEEDNAEPKIIGDYYHLLLNVSYIWATFENQVEVLARAINIREKLEDKLDLAVSYNNLGVIHKYVWKLDESEHYYLKSLSISQSLDNDSHKSLVISNLIEICILKDVLEESLEYFRQLETIYLDNINNKYISLLYEFSNALILKNSKSFRNLDSAKEIFHKIVYEMDVIQFQYYLLANFNLCEIYISEFKSLGKIQALESIEELLNNLIYKCSNQNNKVALKKAKLLHSQYLVLVGDFEEAKDILFEISEIDDGVQDERLSVLVESELEYLIEMEDFITSRGEDEFYDRLELTNLSSILRNFIRPNYSKSVEHETPILLLVTNEAGTVLYSKNFTKNKIEEQVLGTFLNSINSFIGNSLVIDSNEMLQRLIFNDYIISIKTKFGIKFTYIYKGRGAAMKKLSKLLFDLSTMFEDILTEQYIFSLEEKHLILIEDLVNSIFIQ